MIGGVRGPGGTGRPGGIGGKKGAEEAKATEKKKDPGRAAEEQKDAKPVKDGIAGAGREQVAQKATLPPAEALRNPKATQGPPEPVRPGQAGKHAGLSLPAHEQGRAPAPAAPGVEPPPDPGASRSGQSARPEAAHIPGQGRASSEPEEEEETPQAMPSEGRGGRVGGQTAPSSQPTGRRPDLNAGPQTDGPNHPATGQPGAGEGVDLPDRPQDAGRTPHLPEPPPPPPDISRAESRTATSSQAATPPPGGNEPAPPRPNVSTEAQRRAETPTDPNEAEAQASQSAQARPAERPPVDPNEPAPPRPET